MVKERIVFNPRSSFEEQGNRNLEIERAIEKELGMPYEKAHEKYRKICERVAKRVGNQRTVKVSNHVGAFFAHLYAAIYGGEVRETNYGYSDFHADVVDEGDMSWIGTEVKSVAVKNGAPKLGCTQFGHALGKLYRLTRSGIDHCEINYAIFKYGKGNKGLELSKETNDGLIRVLSKQVKSLLIVPLNVLIPMVMRHKFREYDHGTSTGQRSELYSEPHGGLITDIHNHRETIEDLFDDAADELDERELCLDEVRREETQSPDNLFCGRYRVSPFIITRYYNQDSMEWARVFAGKNGTDGSWKQIFERFDLSEEFFLKKRELEQSTAFNPEDF